MKIFVDDVRMPPRGGEWFLIKNSADTIAYLDFAMRNADVLSDPITLLSLDHDLGQIVTRGKCTCGEVTPENRLGHKDGCRYFADTKIVDDTTRPIVLWMCENDFWPDEVVVHSANAVGIDWLEGMIERYKPHRCEDEPCDRTDTVKIMDKWWLCGLHMWGVP